MLADLPSTYMLTSIITAIVGTLTLVITLGIVAWQTTHAAKQTKLNTIISYYQYYKDINVVILEHEQTADRVLGESKEDAMATIVLLTFALAFRLHKERLTSPHWWKTDEASLIDAMKQERVRLHWERYKHEYEPKFVQYIDGVLQELDGQKQSTS